VSAGVFRFLLSFSNVVGAFGVAVRGIAWLHVVVC
jgi:hypothetical protein